PPSCEISGRGIEAAGEYGHAAGGEGRVVSQFTHADGDVEVLADEIDETRGEIQLERDRRVFEGELGQQRRQDDVGYVAWHGHTQAAARLDLPVVGERLRCCHVLHDVACMVEHRQPEVRHVE